MLFETISVIPCWQHGWPENISFLIKTFPCNFSLFSLYSLPCLFIFNLSSKHLVFEWLGWLLSFAALLLICWLALLFKYVCLILGLILLVLKRLDIFPLAFGLYAPWVRAVSSIVFCKCSTQWWCPRNTSSTITYSFKEQKNVLFDALLFHLSWVCHSKSENHLQGFHFHQFPGFLHLTVFSCSLINLLHIQSFKCLFLTTVVGRKIKQKYISYVAFGKYTISHSANVSLKFLLFFSIEFCKNRNSGNVPFIIK